MIPVTAEIGQTAWTTSLFPKDGRYVDSQAACARSVVPQRGQCEPEQTSRSWPHPQTGGVVRLSGVVVRLEAHAGRSVVIVSTAPRSFSSHRYRLVARPELICRKGGPSRVLTV